jgi:CubicO group peptidase (beta-lactamase class C family)
MNGPAAPGQIEAAVDEVASTTGFSGVVRVDVGDATIVEKAYGLADRACSRPVTVDSQFGLASGTKGLTALTVVSLIEDGTLDRATTARSILGRDLPLIADDVTVEHLLGHRSGIGDYYDEEVLTDFTDYVLAVPVHRLATTEAYLSVLDGYETKFAAGERFAYNNGGYIVLALIAERVTGTAFDELVRQRVCEPAAMADTAFLRSDELPCRAAVGYIGPEGLRSNLLHLPVKGSGDGGIYTTVADVHSMWNAFFAGRIVSRRWVDEMTRPHSTETGEPLRYGLGFWLHGTTDAVILVGSDAGVSFKTVSDPAREVVSTVLSNTTDGAWPVGRRLDDVLIG